MQPQPTWSGPPLLFVAGALRSGSTLMSLMLDRHPAITNPGEFDFLFDAFGTDGGSKAADALAPQALDEFLAVDRIYQLRPYRIRETGSNAERVRDYVARLSTDRDWLALNVHRNFVSAYELFPEARFIHLVRDPRDCAKSCIGMGWAGNLYHALDPWITAEESWDRLEPRLPAGQKLEVRFEDLVARPQEVLTRICEFVNLTYDARMLDLTGTTYSSPSPRFANQWRRNMSPQELRLVEARVGPAMAGRGYEITQGPAPALSAWTMLKLKLQNAAFRHRFRIARYGAGLWLQELLARRLGLREWSRQLHHRMIPIDARHLK